MEASIIAPFPKKGVSSQLVACESCSLGQICFPRNIECNALQQLDSIIVRHTPQKKGFYWFSEGDKFRSVYAVRSGVVKTFRLTESGKEQVCGFYLPGEIIGLDAIDHGYYSTSARVLQPCSVCEIPFDRLEYLYHQYPGLQMHLLNLMSRELHNNQWLITLLGKNSAEERVAAFLCNISGRFKQRGYSARDFILGMPRSDIGNYLGLAVETVSRVFTRFQNDGVLNAKGKQIHIQDLPRLSKIAGLQTHA